MPPPSRKKEPPRDAFPSPGEDWTELLDQYVPEDAWMDEALDGKDRPRPRRKGPKPKRREVFRRVDLHGRTQDQAAQVLEHWIRICRKESGKRLLVVTGRGLHSPGGPVLKTWLPDWARRHAPGAPLRLDPAPVEEGGMGAYYLYV